jgi:uncharacterized protein YndB with AHSA1/START domain
MRGQGSLIDRHTLVFTRETRAPIDVLWDALTVESHLDQWFMHATLDARVGGRFSFAGGWDGRIGELVPKHIVRFDADAGGTTRFVLSALGERSMVTMTDRLALELRCPFSSGVATSAQPGGPGTHWVDLAVGWHVFMDNLITHVYPAHPPAVYAVPLEEHYHRLLAVYHARFAAESIR